MGSLDILEIRDEARAAQRRRDYEVILPQAIEASAAKIKAQEDKIELGYTDLAHREAELQEATKARVALRKKLIEQNIIGPPPLGHDLLGEWQETEAVYTEAMGSKAQLSNVFLPLWQGELGRLKATLAELETLPKDSQAASPEQIELVCGRA